jgi:hypothetical protein
MPSRIRIGITTMPMHITGKSSYKLKKRFFSVEIGILCWMKFYTFESHTVAWISTALMIPIICIFIAFAAHFYLKVRINSIDRFLVQMGESLFNTGINQSMLLKLMFFNL